MPNIVYMAASLDGYIAGPDGDLDWLMSIPNPDGSDHGFGQFMAEVDATLMGRNTFEQVLTFGQWPYTKKVFVWSSKLQAVPGYLDGQAEIVTGTAGEVLSALGLRGFSNVYVYGGRVIQSLLAEDLIDTMIITTVSKVLGDGIPLFGVLDGPLDFQLTSTEVLGPYLVKNRYDRVR
jgi:dihydrofolate reductase